MGFSFLAPAFLLGVLALAVPILIHMTHREKHEVVEFPSLMFLRKIPYRSVRRQKIRQWLLFVLRCLALMFLVAAFARPFLETEGVDAASFTGARELVILLDSSYSMGYADHWERAVDAAHRTIDTVQAEDRATLVLFSTRAEALNQPTSDRGRLHALADTVELGSGATRYDPALKLAKRLLEDSRLPRGEVVLISDFQKVGWEPSEDVRMPSTAHLRAVDLSERTPSNLSVTSVILDRQFQSGRERLTASARLTNKGSESFENVSVALELGGRPVHQKQVSLAPNSSTMVSFDPVLFPEEVSEGTVRVEDDALARDNVFYFVLRSGQSLPVLILEGRGQRVRRSLYLRRALEIGDHPSFDLVVKQLTGLEAGDLERRSVVLLNDTRSPDEGASRALLAFVKAGGGLVIVAGEASESSSWQGPAADLLPGPWGGPIDRSADWGATLSFLDYGHPIFELFNAPHSGDFSPARFFRYRPFDSGVEQGVLARFDDGTVALAEKNLGKGKILVWTSTFDTFWNDLALQPVFLPFVHQLILYAADYVETKEWNSVGDVVDLSRLVELAIPGSEAAAPTELVALKPSGEKAVVSRVDERYLLTLDEQGFFDFRTMGSDVTSPLKLAVNLDLTESDLSSVDPEELIAAISAEGGTSSPAAAHEWTPEELEGRQNVWWYFMVGAFLLLVSETVLSNRLSRGAR